MAIQLTRFDAAEHLTDPEAQQALLDDAFRSGNSGYVAHALGTIARARGMSQVERDTGMTRQALYRAFSRTGNPTLATLLRVTHALGLQLKAAPVEQHASAIVASRA